MKGSLRNMNGSLDFLNMIKNQEAQSRPKSKPKSEPAMNSKPARNSEPVTTHKEQPAPAGSSMIAVIDTETNWRDEVMSIGIALADSSDFELRDKRYYIFEPEVMIGGYFSSVVHMRGLPETVCSRQQAMKEIRDYLFSNSVSGILAYNAKFDYGHLKELNDFEWFDIMRLAAYKQFNSSIPESLPCCKTGRLKTSYGVEPIMRLLTGDCSYCEVHNAVMDAVDELKIARLLGHGIEKYECARI